MAPEAKSWLMAAELLQFWTLFFSWSLALLSLIHCPHRQCTPFVDVHQIISILSFKMFQWFLIVLRVKSGLLSMAHRKRDLLYHLPSTFLWALFLAPDLQLHWFHFYLLNRPVFAPVVPSGTSGSSLFKLQFECHLLRDASSDLPIWAVPLFLPSYFLVSLFYFLIALFTIWYYLCVYLLSLLHESRADTMSVLFTSVFSILGYLLSSEWMKLCTGSWASWL